MELPRRDRGDELLKPGEMTDLRDRVKALAPKHDLTTVIVSAFDHRTRALPFIFVDVRMLPAGVRAIGSVMADSGFEKTRIIMQQWNKNFTPSKMQLDGRIPDMFMISSMHIHSAECDRLIEDACKIDPANRPLIIAGGPRIIYEPWSVFSPDPKCPWTADVAVTGEEYVLLSMLEVLLLMRAANESMRSVFMRARDSGALDDIPGLVYAKGVVDSAPAEELVDTGIQRLLGTLDELPHPVHGYRLLKPPSRNQTLANKALEDRQVKRHSPISSIVMTSGCKFRCAYCPIPAYNQSQYRTKSGECIANEIGQISKTFGIRFFFGADDNFFNRTERTMDIVDNLARKAKEGRPHCNVRIATEVTVHDTVLIKEHLPTIRDAGFSALWLGVEDITAKFVNKSQDKDKTLQAFDLLRANGILPMPMMMHHDEQPLITFKSNYGIINQMSILRKHGALFMQVLMLTPATGSKWFSETYTSGMAFKKVGKVNVDQYMIDGNYVIASNHKRPWIKQLNLLVAYTYFFNPIRMLYALVFSKSNIPNMDRETRPAEEVAKYSAAKKLRRRIKLRVRAHLIDALTLVWGMSGLYHNYRHTFTWIWKLYKGKIERYDAVPTSEIPMRSVEGNEAAHAMPGTVLAVLPKPENENQNEAKLKTRLI